MLILCIHLVNLLKITWLTLIFTIIIFIINYNFFWEAKIAYETNTAEEKYIEPEIKKNEVIIIKPEEKNKLIEYYLSNKYSFNYVPNNYKNEIELFEETLINILEKNIFKEKISKLDIELIKEKVDRRWKMKKKKIFLFWTNENNINEYTSVFIHEFAHYIDIYFLEKKVFLDISSKFYQLSWQSTRVKNKDSRTNDFVSWYAISNKYEDFAESFTYYILHNKDFLEKTKQSKILKLKYDFFAGYIFKNKEFFATNFKKEIELKNYYRDTTQILFDKDKFLNYLKTIN